VPDKPPPSKARIWQDPQLANTIKMSSAGLVAATGSAGLYALVTSPASIGAVPEDYEEKRHHLKGGKGFVNPWDSFKDFNPMRLMASMIWYVFISSKRIVVGWHRKDESEPGWLLTTRIGESSPGR
jgi:hypothetical protein